MLQGPPPQGEEDRWLQTFLDEFQPLGFHAGEAFPRLKEHATAQGLLRDGDVLGLLGLDEDRVWFVRPAKTVYPDGGGYEEAVRCWSRISRGAFRPEGVQEYWERWDGPATIEFVHRDRRFRLTPEYLGSHLQVGLLGLINRMLPGPGRFHEVLDAREDEHFVVFVDPEEAAVLQERLGLPLVVLEEEPGTLKVEELPAEEPPLPAPPPRRPSVVKTESTTLYLAWDATGVEDPARALVQAFRSVTTGLPASGDWGLLETFLRKRLEGRRPQPEHWTFGRLADTGVATVTAPSGMRMTLDLLDPADESGAMAILNPEGYLLVELCGPGRYFLEQVPERWGDMLVGLERLFVRLGARYAFAPPPFGLQNLLHAAYRWPQHVPAGFGGHCFPFMILSASEAARFPLDELKSLVPHGRKLTDGTLVLVPGACAGGDHRKWRRLCELLGRLDSQRYFD